ncbi:hypothetical protein LTR08_004475 [Meristemomyces frigidus]|nr:hypothetical protein LTR08_004475 [Meristemomyces frigidus]
MQAQQADAADQTSPSPDLPELPLVLLIVKTSGSNNGFTEFALPQSVVRRIPVYALKLNKALEKAGSSRACVTDNIIRRKEVVIQAVEYLAYGKLKTLDVGNWGQCFDTLTELIYLYDFGVTLSIDELQHAVVDHITECDGLAPDMFVHFAAECYREGKGHKITPDCLLGQFIKKNLGLHLPGLVESGAVNDIKEVGGTLNKQLVEVFTDFYMAQMKSKIPKDEEVKTEVKD